MNASIAIVYEHPSWFEPLFDILARRGVDAARIDANILAFDPASPDLPSRLIFNRVAMSAPQREAEHCIFHAIAALDHWRRRGARIINGPETLALDASKARQLSLIAGLGFATPRTRVVHRIADLPDAARAIGFPLLVKANIGGAGAGIVRFDDLDQLSAACADRTVPHSVDGVLLVQAYGQPRDGKIVRIETLAGRFLYAIEVVVDGNFDLCPADACLVPGRNVKMTVTHPSPTIIAAAEAIVTAAGIDVGGVEYFVDDADGIERFYDINALSNFVANPVDILGFDPHDRLVDYLLSRITEGDVR